MQPNTPRNLPPQIVEYGDSISERDVDTIIADTRVEVVQTSRPVERKTLERLARIFDRRPEVTLRFYGFYGTTCDLSIVRHVPNVRRFAADCLVHATGLQHLALLERLERLSIGIYTLTDFTFLDEIAPGRLTDLALHRTRSKKPSIDSIARFDRLQTLYLEGQQGGVEAVARLSDLRKITFRSITVPSLAFLRGLRHLESLDIKLGGTKDLETIASFERLRYLELWKINGLADLAPLSNAIALQFLFLESLSRVEALPDLSKLAVLRRVHLENMKGLESLQPLETAPALEEFSHVSAQGFEPDDYAGILNLPTLKRLHVGTGSSRKNAKIVKMAEACGIRVGARSDFAFA